MISISDGTLANRLTIEYSQYTNNTIAVQLFANSVSELLFNNIISDYTINNKIAVSFKSGSVKFYANGIKINEVFDTFTFSLNLSQLNFNYGTPTGLPFYGKTKALAVWKEALSDQELADLTYPTPTFPTFTLDFNTIAEQFTFARGSEATYVDAQGLIQSTASNNAPRLDYSTGAEAFLLEPQSTNLITYSSDFSNASWIKTRSSISSNSAISPDGTLNADKLIEDTSTNTHSTQNNVTIGNVDTTISVFVKADTRSRVRFILTDLTTGDYRVDLNLNNLSVIENNGGNIGSWTNTSYKIENFTNNWYKVSLTATKGAGSQASLSINLLDNSGNHAYTGDGTSGLYIYGAQLEQKSYATSYIPSEGSQTTRNQETCINATPEINSEEGTLYAEISAFVGANEDRQISISDGGTSNRVVMAFLSNGTQMQFVVASGGSITVNNTQTISTITSLTKIAFAYKANDFKIYANGSLIASDTSGAVPTGMDTLGFDRGDGNDKFFGNTKDVQVYTKALSDAELIKLTTI